MTEDKVLMAVTVRDTVTGAERTVTRAWWPSEWAEGNWSCDCNRHGTFFPDRDWPDWVSDLAIGESFCHGCVRYRVVAVDPMPPGYTLADFNEGYFPEPPHFPARETDGRRENVCPR